VDGELAPASAATAITAQTTPVSGETFQASAPARASSVATSPTVVIEHANAVASQGPETDGFVNAIMTYTFMPGGIYHVYTAPENVTDLVLEPGEEITGEPAAGDTLRWRLGVGASSVAGVPQTHVFIKPTRAGLTTNLTLNTNRRTYFLRLESVETASMVAVQWSYPQTDSLSSPATSPTDADERAAADVSALHFDYTIEVVEGAPTWKPQAVFDDGRKTYIRFHKAILHGESPALFVIERGELQLVNYRVKKDLYIVDRLFREAELRLGQKDQDIVRIKRK
jgi:type IV secretion system protein VirB9